MAEEVAPGKPLVINSFLGIDESVQPTDGNAFFSSTGVLTFRNSELKRMSGKVVFDALVDGGGNVDPAYSIHQISNGFGQQAKLVQTGGKLYLYVAQMPVDTHCSFTLPTSLGTDSNGNTLDLFTAPAPPTPAPDTTVSPVFGYSTPPFAVSQAHPGVDYVVVKVNPVSAGDVGMSCRLQSLNTGTLYDGYDVGFYFTQNACRYDSIPVIDTGNYEIPSNNSLNAFLAWGGSALIPGWSPVSPLANGIINWAFTAPGPDTTNQAYATNQIGMFQYVNGTGTPSTALYVLIAVDGNSRATWQQLKATNILWEWNGAGTTNAPALPGAGNIGKYGINYQALQVYQLTNVSGGVNVWTLVQGPFNIKESWSYADANARTGATGFVSGDKGKFAFQQSDGTVWVLTGTAPTWVQVQLGSGFKNPDITYATDYLRVHANVTSSDIGKIAYVTGTGQFWELFSTQTHSSGTDRSEYFFINFSRLFLDYQNVSPPSIQFLLKGYWLNAKAGTGNVTLTVTTYLGGTPSKTDTITIQVTGGTTQATSTTTQNTSLVQYGDAKGNNMAIITITMSNGAIGIAVPPVNSDGATLCPY